jgi:hypothetical protein
MTDTIKYDGSVNIPIARPLTQDIGGTLIYEQPFQYVTQGGLLGS